MDYGPMWAVVDAHRRCADELAQTLRELTGDRPAPEATAMDKIVLYSALVEALTESRDALYEAADREGHIVRRRDASRYRVFAGRCDRILSELWKAKEL